MPWPSLGATNEITGFAFAEREKRAGSPIGIAQASEDLVGECFPTRALLCRDKSGAVIFSHDGDGDEGEFRNDKCYG